MNLQIISSELTQLTALVAEWTRHNKIPDIEREIALDKLKTIYADLKLGIVDDAAISEKLAKVDDVSDRKLQGLFFESTEGKEVQQEKPLRHRSTSAFELEELIIPDFPDFGGRAKENEEKRLTPEEAAPILDAISNLAGSINRHAKPAELLDRNGDEPILEIENPVTANFVKEAEPISMPKSAATTAAAPVAAPQNVRMEECAKTGDRRLGEMIASAKSSLNEVISPKGQTDLASKLQQKPVADLHKAISFNDKFRLIRALFNGNGKAYDSAIGELNKCETLDEALIYIQENYSWDASSPEVNLLVELLQRKFM